MEPVVKVITVCSLMIQSQNRQWSANITSSAAAPTAPGAGKLHRYHDYSIVTCCL